MGSVYLHDLICPRPDFETSQSAGNEWLQQAYQKYQSSQNMSGEDYQRLLKRVGVSEGQISKRGHFLPDFKSSQQRDSQIFLKDGPLGISSRQKFYTEAVEKIFNRLYESRSIPEHLLHVSCTGYVSPSAPQKLAALRSPETVVTHAYHMGCYGAFPALRIARGFVQSEPEKSVDVVHTELCTLHLDPVDPSLEQMVVQTLFADGVAAYQISSERPEFGLEVCHLGEFLIPETAGAMSWGIGERGFEMSLSKDVPKLIATHLQNTLKKWESQAQVNLGGILRESIVAVHPGGPKIIDFVMQNLDLRPEQVQYSRDVLYEFGNMSSATVPHIWKKILQDPTVRAGQPVISLAFGPGLTVSLVLMKVLR